MKLWMLESSLFYLAITFFTRIKMWVEGNGRIGLGLLEHLMEAPAIRAPFGIFLEILICNAEKILQLGETIMNTKFWCRDRANSSTINRMVRSILQQCQIHCQFSNAGQINSCMHTQQRVKTCIQQMILTSEEFNHLEMAGLPDLPTWRHLLMDYGSIYLRSSESETTVPFFSRYLQKHYCVDRVYWQCSNYTDSMISPIGYLNYI